MRNKYKCKRTILTAFSTEALDKMVAKYLEANWYCVGSYAVFSCGGGTYYAQAMQQMVREG